MTLFILLSCSSPELSIFLDEMLVTDALMKDGRILLEPPMFMLGLQNTGTGIVQIDALNFESSICINEQLPITLSKDEEQKIAIQVCGGSEGVYREEILFTGTFPQQTVVLTGSLESYIRVQPQDITEVSQAFEEEFIEQELIGAAVGIVEGQDIIFLEGMGYANREEEIRVDPKEHRFRWASLSKGLTAYVTMQQVARELIDLQQPISQLYPYVQPDRFLLEDCTELSCSEDVPSDRADITLRHLFSHIAGIQHYSNGLSYPVPSIASAADPEINTGMEWALPLFLSNPLVAIPDTTYSYTTFGYNLAGVVVESAVQRTLPEMVSSEISEPAGITTLTPDYQWAPEPNRVVGYDRYQGVVFVSGDTDVSWKLAGGGFQSTVEDLARYCAVLLGDELLDASFKSDFLWNVPENAGTYAMGFEVDEERNLVYHTGAQQSTRTALVIERDTNRCYVGMSNSTWAKPLTLLKKIREAHLD